MKRPVVTEQASDLVVLSELAIRFSSDERTYYQTTWKRPSPGVRALKQKVRWQRECKHLGGGTFGQVYMERCLEAGRKEEKRAVKSIGKIGNIDYKRELEALAVFSYKTEYQDSFVKFFGWYETDKHIHIVMELHELGSLDSYLASTHTSFHEVDVKLIVTQILEALAYMHKLRFMHRDLKPANVLVVTAGPQWWVKIADFGFSKRAVRDHTAMQTGGGTPLYMAPEMQGLVHGDMLGEPGKVTYSSAVDIWAVGVMTHQILTGRTPFHAGELAMYSQGAMAFPTTYMSQSAASDEACDFVRRLTTPQPNERPDARECLELAWLYDQVEGTAEDPMRTLQPQPIDAQPTQGTQESLGTWSSEQSPTGRGPGSNGINTNATTSLDHTISGKSPSNQASRANTATERTTIGTVHDTGLGRNSPPRTAQAATVHSRSTGDLPKSSLSLIQYYYPRRESAPRGIAVSSDSDADARREYRNRQRERDPHYERPKPQAERSERAFNREDLSHTGLHGESARQQKTSTRMSDARDYIESSKRPSYSRSHEDPATEHLERSRRPSPLWDELWEDEFNHVRTSNDRPILTTRRGRGDPRPADRKPEPKDRHVSDPPLDAPISSNASPEPRPFHTANDLHGSELEDHPERPTAYRIEARDSAAATSKSRTATRSPSPVRRGEIPANRAASSRYRPAAQRPPPVPFRPTAYAYKLKALDDLPNEYPPQSGTTSYSYKLRELQDLPETPPLQSRTSSYVYTPQDLRDVPAAPNLSSNSSRRSKTRGPKLRVRKEDLSDLAYPYDEED